MPRQAGLQPPGDWRIAGTVVRAVVIRTYFADEEKRVGVAEANARGNTPIKAVSCDVLTYGGRHRFFLPRIPVAQAAHGLNDHDLWIPRPSTIDLKTGQAPVLPQYGNVSDPRSISDPRNLDGDHVLVEFLENDPQQAFVRFDQLPHPSATYRMERADGERRRSRFRGVVQEIDEQGNLTVDTTQANDGVPDPALFGVENPASDAAHGNVTFKVNSAAELTIIGLDQNGANEEFRLRIKDGELLIRLDNGESFLVQGSGNGTVVTVGDGGENVVTYSHLEALWNATLALIDTHVHPSGMGPTGPPVPLLSATQSLPTGGANVKSTKVIIPPQP
jgi:hypothetical protein